MYNLPLGLLIFPLCIISLAHVSVVYYFCSWYPRFFFVFNSLGRDIKLCLLDGSNVYWFSSNYAKYGFPLFHAFSADLYNIRVDLMSYDVYIVIYGNDNLVNTFASFLFVYTGPI